LLNLRKKFTDEFNHIRQDDEHQQQKQQPRIITTSLYQSPITSSSTNLPTQTKTTTAQTSATFIS
jgi:hypothetical protein